MSQAKVDQYKKDKKNRKQIMAKEKREWFLTQAAVGLIGAAIVVWIGFSAYNVITAPKDTGAAETVEYTIDSSALTDYLDTLSED
jgi:hypothetical protein